MARVGIGLFRCNADGTIVDIDRTAFNIMGIDAVLSTQLQAVGKNLFELITCLDFSCMIPDDLCKNGLVTGLDFHFKRPSGEERWALIDLLLVENQDEIQVVIRDITDSKQSELNLKYQLTKAERYLDVADVMLLVIDQDGLISWINKKGTEILISTKEDLIGKNWFDEVVPPEIRDETEKNFNQLMAGNTEALMYYEYPVLTVSGEKRLIAWNNTVLSDEHGRIYAGICSGQDITERLKTEEALRENEERLRTLINSMPDIVCFKDGNGRWLEANDFDLQLFGLTGVDYRGKTDCELAEYSNFYRDSFLTCEDTDEHTWKAGEPVRSDETIPVPDGPSKVFDIIKVPMFYPDGRRKGLVVIGRDITERKQAEEALQNSEQRYRALVEQSPLSTQIFSPDGVTLYANPAFCRLWHASPEAIEYLIGHYRILEDKQLESKGLMPYIKRAFAGEAVQLPTIEYEIEQANEQLGIRLGLKTSWIHGYMFPTKDGNGNIREVVLMHEDVTAQVRTEGALKARARQQAAVADLGQRALAGIDPNTLMDEAVVLIAQSLDVEYSKVLELLPDGKALLRAGVGWKEGLVGTETVSVGLESQAGYALSVKEPVITDDLPAETRFKGLPLLIDHGVISGITVIIQYGERPYGVLGAHTTKRREFTEDDVHFLQGVANILATAIQRKQAEESLCKLNRTLKMLSQVNQILVRASEESLLLDEVCQAIADVGGYRMAWIGYAEQDPEKTVRPVAHAGYEEGYLSMIRVSWADNEFGRGPTGTAIRTGKAAFALDLANEPAYSPWREEALKRGYASSISTPLIANEQTIGVLNIYAGQLRAFDEAEVHLLTELAADLAYGIMSLRTSEQSKRAEEALRDSEERYRSLIDLSPIAIIVHSEGVILFANTAAATLLHAANPDELIGLPALNLVNPDYLDIVRQRIRQAAVEGKKSPILEEKFIALDGTTIDVDVDNMPVTFQGKPAVLVVASDITERKLIEQRRLQMEEHKREFYRRTILAATEGKLEITERDEIERAEGPAIASWEIHRSEDLSVIRNRIASIAESEGMEEPRVYDFVLAAGEATTNVIKHAGTGTASIHRKNDGLLLVVSDRGPGIEALALPDVALKRGYTTAVSLGMGYKAIISIADKVYLATGPGGTTVAIEMYLHAPQCLP